MAANEDGVEGSNGGSCGKDVIWAVIEEQRQQMNSSRTACQIGTQSK